MSQADETYVANGVAHFDIAGPDDRELADFYARVFGWKMESQGPGYTLVSTPDGSPNGAVIEAEAASLIVGISVSDVGEAVAAAESGGGRVTMPPTDNGWIVKAQVQDPAGNTLTLIQI